jgi:hypothetical protein
MANIISIEMKPTNESLSLIRLIVSYFSQTLDFDISEIDNIKQVITKIVYSLSSIWFEQEKVKFIIEENENELKVIIYCYLKDKEKIMINNDNEIISKLSTLMENIYIEEAPNNETAIHLKLKKRNTNV